MVFASIIPAMLDILAFLFLAVVLPLLINKTTEHHLQWIKPHHLRPIWTVVFVGFSLYLLHKPMVLEFAMQLHQRWEGWIGYLIFGLAGALLLSGYWWLTGKMLSPVPAAVASGVNSSTSSDDDDSQFRILNLSPQQKAELDKLKGPLFRYKAALLDSPEYYEAKVAKDNYRNMLEALESEHRCLIDTVKLECLPKPPVDIAAGNLEIEVTEKVVADETSKGRFWIIREKRSKLRIPIVMFVSVTNRQKEPLKLDLLYLEAKSVGGWADVRMADTFLPNTQTMNEKPLVFEANNACISMKGDYLLPSLYDRVIQPGDKVEGWIIAEYPRGFKYGNSIGEMRISLLAANLWVASKTFNANPPVYKDHFNGVGIKEFYFMPLDTLITDEQ
jgi:hypothetical protein